MSASGADADRWVVLLPVKSPGAGKTRLGGLGGVGPADRARLAAAFAADTVEAALAAEQVTGVVVVSDDHDFASGLARVDPARVHVCPDPGAGLNAALRAAARAARATWPGARPVAVCADLPALRAADLDAALHEAARSPGTGFVADGDGTGTTLYAGAELAFEPRFGVGSASAHAADGARPLVGDWPTLRRDVDDRASLEDAVALGVGRATAAVLASMDDAGR